MAGSMNNQVIKTKMSLALIRASLAAYANTQRNEFRRDLYLDPVPPLPPCLVGKSVERKGNNLDLPGEGL